MPVASSLLDADGLGRAFDRWPNGLRALLETIPSGVFALDGRGRIIGWNAHMEALTGYRLADVHHERCTVLEGSACNDGPCLTPDTHGCSLFTEGRVRARRCSLRRRDGSTLPVLKNAQLVRDAEGVVVGAVEIVTDLRAVTALEAEVAELRRQVIDQSRAHGMVGRHPAMQRLFEVIEMAGAADASVLVLGETGVGKELVAHAIHRASARRDGPFVRVCCGALPDTLLESELFGHVRGAFTNAVADRVGRFEAAHGGTIFLDEIGDISAATQTRLLRVLQAREFERVGDSRTRQIDIRVIAATHRDLRAMIAAGTFREDLYYRLAVLPITVPPLRDRRTDVPLLVDHVLDELGERRGRTAAFTPEALRRLIAHDWPGNVRELRHAVEHAFVLDGGDALDVDALPAHLLDGPTEPQRRQGLDRATIEAALEATGGKRAAAAEALGVSRVTLWKWMKRLGIQPKDE